MKNLKEAWLVYDGKCPVCNTYVHLFRANKTIKLHLIDARNPSALMDEVTIKNLDIDEGMVLKIDDILYYGSDAMYALALIGTPSDVFNKINYYLFRSKTLSYVFYPFAKSIRNLLLWIMHIPKINNLKIKNHKE